jgi:hypothetical protein
MATPWPRPGEPVERDGATLRTVWRTIFFGVAAFGFAACGGRAANEDDAGMPEGSARSSNGGSSSASGSVPAASSSDGGSPGSGQGPGGSTPPGDAGATANRDAAPIRCAMGGGGGGSAGGGGGGGPASCDIMAQETCAGVSYQVSCACPAGSCACFGPTTSIVSFAGCPTCPTIAQAFQACGFPQ